MYVVENLTVISEEKWDLSTGAVQWSAVVLRLLIFDSASVSVSVGINGVGASSEGSRAAAGSVMCVKFGPAV
jgi:hypothetical protein